MKKKFTNKSLDKNFESPLLPLSEKKCSLCGKIKSDTKIRRLYDYINNEVEEVFCCSDCENNIQEDL